MVPGCVSTRMGALFAGFSPFKTSTSVGTGAPAA